MVTILLVLPALLLGMLFGLDVLEGILFPQHAEPRSPDGPAA
ncbi:hypothetical protein AB0A05_37500 [Streptomyces sp. NPDC046374]